MLIIKNLNRMNSNTFSEEQISILNDFLEFLDQTKNSLLEDENKTYFFGRLATKPAELSRFQFAHLNDRT